jgi:glycosyltransferase involved in cell wall biosynthesis
MPDSRRTIVFVHGSDEWYGSDYVLHEIVRSLAGSEFDATVLVPDDIRSEVDPRRRLSGRLRTLGIPVHALPLTVLRRRYMTPGGVARLVTHAPGAVRAALAAIGHCHVALVHSHTATVMTGAGIARALGVPHLWHVSEMVERPRAVRSVLSRHIVRSSDRIVAVSAAVREHILATQPAAAPKIAVIHNGIDVGRFSVDVPRACAEPDSVPGMTVGMIGRVGTWKGQELFLSAATIVARELPDARFVLAGGVLDGNMAALEKLRAQARDCGIADRVTIREYCADTPELLRTFDVFVQSSLRPDPLPTTVLEAMASATPVVATAHGGAPEMVQDGVTGLLVRSGDAEAMAFAIIRLLRDPAMRSRMGEAGRDRVTREFSPAAFSAAYLRVYRELARGQPRPAP